MTQDRRLVWSLCLAPLGLYFILLFMVPLIYFIHDAFYVTSTTGQIQGSFSMHTFSAVTHGYYLSTMFRTLELCVLVSVISLIVATPMAFGIVHAKRWGRVVFVVIVAAMFSSAIARVLGWEVLLAPHGLINRVLLDLRLISSPLALTNNFLGVTIGSVHAIVPLAVIALMPACQQVTPQQMEAGTSLGASPWRVFGRVALPQLGFGIASVGLLALAITAGTFTTPALLGGGRVGVVSVLIYTIATQSFDYSTASALALELMVVVAVIVFLGLFLARRAMRPDLARS